jgi:aminopeptidase N
MASYLTTLAVGQYAHRTATGPRGLPLEFWVPATEQRKYLSVLRHAASDLGWLEDELGRYPFESAGVVIVPGASAMETQTLVTFGAKLWTSSTYARRTVVHELAHQWWGDTVTPSDWRDLWLNEGMAMYVEARWSSELEHIPWRIWADFFRYENSTLRRHEGGPGAYKPRMFAENCVYYCTAAMYETIRKEIGNHAFWRLVRTWTHRAPDSNVDRAAFEGLVEQMTGRSWTRFFRTWLNSSTWPPK